MERFSADDLRARLGGSTSDEAQATIAPVSTPFTPPLPASKPGFRKGAQAAESTPEAPAAPRSYRVNKYAGTCPLCETRVEAGEGSLSQDYDERWVTSHLPGACAPMSVEDRQLAEVGTVPKATTSQASQSTIKAVTGQVYTGIHPGLYTVETEEGHRTFRVRVQGTDEDFAPGQTVLEYLVGPDNGNDYTGIAFLRGTKAAFWKRYQGEETTVIREDAQAFLADPDGALKAKNCIRCNAVLTEPMSIEAGMGPTCRNKGW